MKYGDPQTAAHNLIFDAEAVAQAEKLVICVPGALTRISMFDPVKAWRSDGWEPVFYPFPGLDGRAMFPPLAIGQAAREISDFARAHPHKQIHLVGFSTGAPIALMAASALPGTVLVAAVSPALPRAGGVLTALRLARLLGEAAVRARSVALRPVWLEYYRVLLFGSKGLRDAEIARESVVKTRERLPEMVFPERRMLQAHTRDLRCWRLPEAFEAGHVQIFAGSDDPVFSTQQTRDFANALGVNTITNYAGHGHLLFLTVPGLFDDVRAFFDAGDKQSA